MKANLCTKQKNTWFYSCQSLRKGSRHEIQDLSPWHFCVWADCLVLLSALGCSSQTMPPGRILSPQWFWTPSCICNQPFEALVFIKWMKFKWLEYFYFSVYPLIQKIAPFRLFNSCIPATCSFYIFIVLLTLWKEHWCKRIVFVKVL